MLDWMKRLWRVVMTDFDWMAMDLLEDLRNLILLVGFLYSWSFVL